MSLEKLEARDRARDLEMLAGRLNEEFDGDYHRSVAQAWIYGATVALNTAAGRSPCRICGCWELQACERGCSWVEADLCSACTDAVTAEDPR